MLHSPESINCNILLIGKTGTGKSSFANYLFDTDIFTTGSGEPVTGWEDNFQHHRFYISDISINVYDSVGLEPDNFIRWTDELDTFLSERQPDNWGTINSANDIIHTIFYVVNGAGTRVEETEIDVLKNMRDTYNLSASVIITNCDIAKEHELSAIESKVKKHSFSSFRVCSVSKKTRGGDKVESFGKESAVKKILSDSYEKVGKELTLSLLRETIKTMNDARKQAKAKIDAADLSIFKLDSISNIDLEDIFPSTFDIADIIPPEYKSYQNFLEWFDMDYQGRDIMNETIDNLSDILGKMDENSIKLGRKANKIINDLENGNFLEKAGAILQTVKVVFTLKKTLKEGVDEMFDLVAYELCQQIWKVESTTFDNEKDGAFNKSQVVLTKWGIRYKNSKFDLIGVLNGHKRLSDGSVLGNTSGIVNVTVDYDIRKIIFETLNTVYSCSFNEYTAKYLNDCETYWKEGSASPKVFDDIIKQLTDKKSKLYEAVMSGMINTIVDDLKKRIDADKDITINISEVLQWDFENKKIEGKKTLYNHMGDDIKFTGSRNNTQNERQLDEDELLAGEISAVTFEIGGYIIRSAERVYKVLEDYTEIPADKDAVESTKEQKNNLFGIGNMRGKNIRIKNEVSAKRIRDELDAFTDGYMVICQASQGLSWCESINYICTILVPPLFSLSNEILFVNNHYMGDSFNSETWYSLNPSGIIKSYKIHPYDPDSFEAAWNDAD